MKTHLSKKGKAIIDGIREKIVNNRKMDFADKTHALDNILVAICSFEFEDTILSYAKKMGEV